MSRASKELAAALEALRDRSVVNDSRDYARRWAQAQTRAASLRKRVLLPAGVLAIVGALVYFLVLPQLGLDRALVTTAIGETRTVALDDGSRIVLDTSSRMRVSFSASVRDIELLDGQAQFQVARDAHRPFRVRTGTAEIVALGTLFDVARLPSRTTVTLIEGRVRVRTISPEVSSLVEALVPGQQLRIGGDGQLLDKKPVKIEDVTAWQRGKIVLDDMPLGEALATLNRYSRTQIVIRDTALQSRHISGAFRSGDVETEAVTLQRYFGLKESARSDSMILLEPN